MWRQRIDLSPWYFVFIHCNDRRRPWRFLFEKIIVVIERKEWPLKLGPSWG